VRNKNKLKTGALSERIVGAGSKENRVRISGHIKGHFTGAQQVGKN
jgi:hypothetical protein